VHGGLRSHFLSDQQIFLPISSDFWHLPPPLSLLLALRSSLLAGAPSSQVDAPGFPALLVGGGSRVGGGDDTPAFVHLPYGSARGRAEYCVHCALHCHTRWISR
jgi:hypothetical protein